MNGANRHSQNGRSMWTVVVAGGLIVGLTVGVRHAQGIFLLPISLDRGWPRDTVAFAMALQNLVWGLAQPFTGMLADRFGSRRVLVIGLLTYAAALLLAARAGTAATFALSAGVLLGIALSGSAFGIVFGAISRLVSPDRRSWALGLAGSVGGAGQFVLVPLAQGLLQRFGWSGALSLLGLAALLLLPCAFVLNDRPAAASGPQLSLHGAMREAAGHSGFWLLNLGFFVCGFQLAFVASHLPAYLLDHGMTGNDAVAALALIAFANILGTYAFGWLGGRLRRKYLLAGLYLFRTLAMLAFVLLPLSHASLYLFAAVMGFVWLGTLPLTNGLVSQVFGVQYITTLFGFVFFAHQLGAFFGVWLGGYVYDLTHSYDWIWAGSIGLGVIATLVHVPINDRAIVRKMAPA